MQTHMDTPKHYECDICHERFTFASSVRRHKNRYHFAPVDGESGFRCEFCGATFSKQNSLTNHMVSLDTEVKLD
jgi:hypothetical protein